MFCWLVATSALMVAVPAGWAQRNVVDEGGYAVLAEQAAHDRTLQSAMAAELATRAMKLINERTGGQTPVDSATVHNGAAAFTAGPSFPPLFAQVNRAAHAWLFSAPQSQSGDQWVIDIAPMLKDTSIQQTLDTYNVKVPDTLKVPVTESVGKTQGQLHSAAVWGPRIGYGAAALAAVFALLTLVFARGRGRALTALGVSALLVGAVGWAGIEMMGRYTNQALNQTTGDISRIADVMIGQGESSLREWLNLTLATGAGLVIFGLLVALLGSLFRKKT